jgi:penicillin-binding protein 2
MLATPLQLANLMAIIANSGYYYTPHFVDSVENETIEDSSFFNKYRKKHTTTHISGETYAAIHEGMHDVTIIGTASHIKIPGINYCAKTGTAQNPHGKNHSIFVAYAPAEDPQIAVAVVIENAGYGATWAGPIASFMIEKYLNDTIATDRLKDIDRVSSADLIPEAIRHWYYRKDSLAAIKAAKVETDTIPNTKLDNNLDNRKVTFDPEAEPNRKDSTPGNEKVPQQTPAIAPADDNRKRPNNNKP